MLTLYSGPLSMFGAKVQIAMLEKGIAFDLRMVPFDANDGYQPKHPEVVRINPVRKQVPVLIDGDLEIFDSTQIFEYLEDLRPIPPLWPGDAAASCCGGAGVGAKANSPWSGAAEGVLAQAGSAITRSVQAGSGAGR